LIEALALLRSPAVIRFRVLLGTALILSAIVGTFVSAQLTDEEKKKRDVRTKAREEMRAVDSPAPAETPEPTAKPKPANRKAKSGKLPKAKETPTPRPRKSPTPEAEESPKPKSKAKSNATKSDEEDDEPAPKPKGTDSTEEDETPQSTKKSGVEKSPTPALTPKPKSKPGTEKTSKKDEEAKVTPKPKRKKKAASKEVPGSKKRPHARKSPPPEPEESPTPKPGAKKQTEATKEATPKRIEKAEPAKSPAPSEKLPKTVPELTRAPAPEPPVRPPPVSTLPQAALPADITVEKSGLEKEQGLEPPPPPPPRRGLWPWSRQPANYRYLTSATIDAIRRAPVQRARWKFIIVHNSGTRQGNARAFDYYHRKIRRMRNGLAYHFVIGNGTSSRNGQIEIGDRWRRQINGGHVHSDYMNNIGLGICLVGDFNRDQPTRAQLEATEELIRYLQERCGKSDGRSLMVRPHREVNPPRWATDCPGDAFPYGWFGKFR
jgi:hypothetical protein